MNKNNRAGIELIAIAAIFSLAIFSILLIVTAPAAPIPSPTPIPSPLPPTVHNLDTEEVFPTINAAIADSDTKDGHTITVDAGTRIENVDVWKSLTIRSTSGNPANTIVQAKISYDHVFEVTANWVNISGFTVQDATGIEKAGIYLYNVDHCTISENIASGNAYGIYLSSSSNNTLTGNTANSNNYGGIYLYSSSNNNTLTGNTANLNNEFGILLESSSNNNLTNNTANSNSVVGLILGNSSDNTLTNNSVSNNDWGIALLENSGNNLIFNNYFNNTNNAYDECNNHWNVSKTAGTNIIGGPYLGGNYWSDYAGNDTDGDGLGNTSIPYNNSGIIVDGGDYLPLTEERVSQVVNPGETVTTDPESMGPTVYDPVETSVTTPIGGTVSIEETPATEPPPEGFYIIGQQVTITAPDATPEDPLTIVFKINATQIPVGGLNEIVVFKDGDPVGDCTGDPGQASPDPCISSRVMPNGDGEITVLTVSASRWSLGYPISSHVQLIQNLINSVNDLNLQHGIDNSLDAKLEAAMNALQDINANNDVATINSLQAFISAVEAQRDNKISDTEADELIAAVQEIIASLT